MKGGTFVRLLWLEGEGEERERLLEDWEELRLVSTMVLGCGVGEGGVHPFVVVCVVCVSVIQGGLGRRERNGIMTLLLLLLLLLLGKRMIEKGEKSHVKIVIKVCVRL